MLCIEKQLHLARLSKAEDKALGYEVISTLLTEQGLLVPWQGGEHTQHYFCLCNPVNDIFVLFRAQLRNQCSY